MAAVQKHELQVIEWFITQHFEYLWVRMCRFLKFDIMYIDAMFILVFLMIQKWNWQGKCLDGRSWFLLIWHTLTSKCARPSVVACGSLCIMKKIQHRQDRGSPDLYMLYIFLRIWKTRRSIGLLKSLQVITNVDEQTIFLELGKHHSRHLHKKASLLKSLDGTVVNSHIVLHHLLAPARKLTQDW